jgi:hypothetical protein
MKGKQMTLNINIGIGEITTEICSDESLSFDAIESLLNRSVQSVLVMFNSLDAKDRSLVLGLEDADDETDEEEDA